MMDSSRTSSAVSSAATPRRRAVTLVSGPGALARQQAIATLRAAHEGGLWLQTGDPGLQRTSTAGTATKPPVASRFGFVPASVPDQNLAAGCICCLGGPVFRTTLVRLLRRTDWQHLYLDVAQEGEHLQRIVDQLWLPPFSQHLQLVAMVRALPEERISPAGQGEGISPAEGPGDMDAGDAGRDVDETPLAGKAATGPDWPESAWAARSDRLRASPAEHAGWASLVLAGRHWKFHDPLDLDRAADGTDPVPVMASVVSDAAAASMAVTLVAAATIPNIAPKAAPEATTETTPENTPEAAPVNLHHRWLPELGAPSRQEAQEALQQVLAVPGVQQLQAVLQTGRSAYDWRYAAGEAAAETVAWPPVENAGFGRKAPNLSAALRSQETVWRLDNRVRLGLAQGTDLARLHAALAALEALWS